VAEIRIRDYIPTIRRDARCYQHQSGTKAEVKAALIAAEQRHIDVLNACDSAIGYNINVVATSRLGVKASPETRARIGASKKGKTFHLGIPHSAETKELLRQQATGKTWTPEMRANFVMSRKGRPHSEEHSANLRASLRRLHKSDERDARKAQEKAERDLTPKRLSDEHRANISKALKGRSKRPFSAQHRAAIAAARTGKSSKAPVGQVSLW
jgi:hypothetical protein